MARNPELIRLRNERIRQVFERMSAQRVKGRRRYTVDHIIYRISTEHAWVSSKVVERVLFGG